MGIETAAALAMGGSALFGAVGQDRANARNTRAQQQARAQMQSMIQPYLTQPGAANPYAQQIQDFIKSGIYGAGATPSVGTEAFNPGQDALMQMMRASPDYQANAGLDTALQGILTGKPYDTTEQFATLGALTDQDLTRQIAGQRAGAGSLGQRFGTANQNAEALLRSTATTNLAAQRAAIGQSAFNQNQQNILGGAGIASGRENAMNQFISQMFGQRMNAAQAAGSLFNQGRQITGQEQQFNQGQQQQNNQFLNNFILQALQGAGGLQQGQNNQNAQLLSILAGQPVPQGQPSAIPGAVGDIGQLALLLPYLRNMGGGGGGAVPTVPMGRFPAMPGVANVGGGTGYGYGGGYIPQIVR